MKRDALKIGSKLAARKVNGQTVEHFVCTFNRPENVADCLKLAGGNDGVVTALFVRGYTIKLQDAVGRPLFEAGESHEAIQKALDAYILGTTKALGRPAKQKVLAIPAQKSYTAAEVEALAQKAGIKVVVA